MTTQDAYGYLVSQRAHIESAAYAIKYADIQYPKIVPVDTSAHEWARSIIHYSTDSVGQAQILANRADDFPLVNISRAQHAVGVEMAGIGYDFTMEELGAAMMVPNTALEAEKVIAARRVYEEYIDNIVLNGDANYGWDSFMDNSNVTKSDAPAGTGGSTEWTSKTPDEVIKDFNNLLTGIWTTTLQVELADTVCMSPNLYSHLANTPRSVYSDMSTLEWIMRYNVFTGQTGSSLNIIMLRGLEDAAAGSKGRVVGYRRAMDVVRLHLPMPLRFGTMQQWLQRFVIPGYFRLGGLEVRRPGAFRYLDLVEA